MSHASHRMRAGAVAAVVSAASLLAPASHALPPGFVDQHVATSSGQAVGICFAPDGRGFVWDKAGLVWLLEDGFLSHTPLIDISEEVGNWRDLGLLGFAIHPDFLANGHIYLLYAVDYHHLRYFGTPEYDPAADQYHYDTIARLTRYTCNAADGFRSVDPSSRRVLVGETMQTGFPITHESHSIGTVLFGEDGSLLVGNGDGSTYTHADGGGPRPGSSNTALSDGIISWYEDVGAMRAQLVHSLSGKIIRIDPETGDGLPSNPYYNPAEPRAARSRVWAMGFRNPFRFTVRPGTGSPDPAAADPGTLYIGDVGWYHYEELDIAPAGGLNFGWPIFEGMHPHAQYFPLGTANPLSPNPLAGEPGCDFPLFRFRDLITQATLGIPQWPNPCDPAVNVPPTHRRYVHALPTLQYGHTRVAGVPVFEGESPVEVPLGDPDSPVIGEQFGGRSTLAGAWYTDQAGDAGFPAQWRNLYYHGDFVDGWIKALVLDGQDRLLEVRPFHDSVGAIVCMAINPVDGAIYYIAYGPTGTPQVRRIANAATAPPTAAASAEPTYGPLPLTVQFSSAGSGTLDGSPVTYQWDFGDASPPSSAANPVHTYTGVVDVTDAGTIVARVFELVPPFPYGAGAEDPEVIRDHDWPSLGGYAITRQYDTTHDAAQGLDEWIGYTFDEPLVVSHITFQEGQHFPHGGWFETLGAEYFDGTSWLPVQGYECTPTYPGIHNAVNFETFTMTFTPVEARGIRIRGVPGGEHRFISVAELRIGGLPVGVGDGPRRMDATLRVRDAAGRTARAHTVVSPANTPPQVEITSPAPGALYRMTGVTPVALRAAFSDAEHAQDRLSCAWTVTLHHNEHNHPEPPIEDCEPTIWLSPAGCDGAKAYWYRLAVTITDAHGLSTTQWTDMHPACCLPDWDLNGALASTDISAYLGAWVAGVGTGSLEADFNADGAVTSADIADFVASWLTAVQAGGC